MRHTFLFEPGHAQILEQARQGCEAIEALEGAWLEQPAVSSFDEEGARARQMLDLVVDAGLLRHAVACPGEALDSRALCLCRETLAYHSGLADFVFAMQGLGSYALTLAGDRPQQALLEEARAGRAIAAFALTEPQAGSDVAALATSAARDGAGYVLNGHKRFISNAGVAHFYTVFARTGEGRGGVTAFCVPAGTPGFEVSRRQEVLSPHPLGELRFDGCRLPASARIGDEGQGWALAFGTLERFRPSVGAAALGLGQRALSEAIGRAQTRVQFGKPLGKQQVIQLKLSTMATELEAARLLVYQAAWLKDHGSADTLREAAMGKLMATEAAGRAVDQAVQIFGGEGVVRGSVVERLYREVRPLRIYEGASEVQHLIIARDLLRGP